MPFGQIVVGPPGSGKTTYCNGMHQFCKAIGRNTIIVNLDPANDFLPYECTIDVKSLISLEKVMETFQLGPNGGLLYCMEYLEKNFDWLANQLKPYESNHYIIFDFPGQVELFTLHETIYSLLQSFQKLDYRLCCVHLVDSTFCSTPNSFISIVLLSLSVMLRLELPHINVLSKIDLIEAQGDLRKIDKFQEIDTSYFLPECTLTAILIDFNLDYYTEVLDLSYLLRHLNADQFGSKFKQLNERLVEVIEDYSLVCFHPLFIEDKEMVYEVLKSIDKANGYIFGGLTSGNESIFGCAERESFQFFKSHLIQERYFQSEQADIDTVMERTTIERGVEDDKMQTETEADTVEKELSDWVL